MSAAATKIEEEAMADAKGFEPNVKIRATDYKIGCIGAGMIMAECHLAAYKEAGFPVVAIASRTKANAEKVAKRWGIPKVYDSPEDLIRDRTIEVLDIAYPPDQQPALIKLALEQKHIKAILAQKPLALSVKDAVELRDAAAKSGKILSVNQNMRYDQSMRVLKQIIDSGALGDIVFAEIDMHAIPHWQTFLEDYDRLTLSNMSVHHLDVLRFLFGDPSEITTLTRKDPRTTFDHSDGITVSTLRFPSGVLAVSLEDVWSGPRQDGYKDDQHINWRVDGTKGVAKGTLGWDTMWFPHAFIGVMEQLQHAVKTGTAPALSVADNVKTMALVEAGYRSIDKRRAVKLSEIS